MSVDFLYSEYFLMFTWEIAVSCLSLFTGRDFLHFYPFFLHPIRCIQMQLQNQGRDMDVTCIFTGCGNGSGNTGGKNRCADRQNKVIMVIFIHLMAHIVSFDLWICHPG